MSVDSEKKSALFDDGEIVKKYHYHQVFNRQIATVEER